MTDLAAFLRARLDEDEKIARRCPIETALPAAWGRLLDGGQYVIDHIARWDSARVLVEVDAKRRIIDLHDNNDPMRTTVDGPPACEGCGANFVEEYAYAIDDCPTKRLLALPYTDHPDYDPAWRPVG